jgi:hypothetical protein
MFQEKLKTKKNFMKLKRKVGAVCLKGMEYKRSLSQFFAVLGIRIKVKRCIRILIRIKV